MASALLSIGASRVGGTAKDPFVLAGHGKSSYAIVLADGASPSERHAARELQHFVQLATGARLPLIDEGASRADKPLRIFIGAGRLVSKLPGATVDPEVIGDEGFVLRTARGEGPSPDIVIVGGRRRGTMYGVYTLLDRLGFRWYTNRKTWYPEGGVLQLEAIDELGGPAFMYREPYINEAFDADWAARNRVNSHSARLDAARGGRVGVLGVHTFNHLIPYSLYQEHPEYFPLIGGERVTGYVQRCLTNQEVVRIAAENLSAWMDKNPDGTFFSLSQEDTENLCECIPCSRKMEEEESPMGLYLDFVNPQRNLLFENLGNGRFEEISARSGSGFAVEKVSRGTAFGDYDEDGDIDILVLNVDDTPSLLRNDGGNRRHWLHVSTIGTQSNRDGIGARIEVLTGSQLQIREVVAGTSFLSQSDMRVHFGLGNAEKVDRLKIRWPSGIVQEFIDLKADQWLVVSEEQGILQQ